MIISRHILTSGKTVIFSCYLKKFCRVFCTSKALYSLLCDSFLTQSFSLVKLLASAMLLQLTNTALSGRYPLPGMELYLLLWVHKEWTDGAYEWTLIL